jgi:hypothetical protein
MSEFHEAQAKARKGMPSWYERLALELTEQQKADLDEALGDRDIYPRSISEVLGHWGYKVSVSQVNWHRKTHGL